MAPSPTLDAEVEKLVRLGYDRDTAAVMVAALVEKEETGPVSYTHLTLPTILLV